MRRVAKLLPATAFTAVHLQPPYLSCGGWHHFQKLLVGATAFRAFESHQWKDASYHSERQPRWSCSSLRSEELVEIFSSAMQMENEREKVLSHVNSTHSALKLFTELHVCLLGYVNALAILLRIALDVNAGRCPPVAVDMESNVAEWLRILLLLWRSPNIPLLLMDSSVWPFRLQNISDGPPRTSWPRPLVIVHTVSIGDHPVAVECGSQL